MKKEYWKTGMAAAILAAAGFCYGLTRWQQGTLLPAENLTVVSAGEVPGAEGLPGAGSLPEAAAPSDGSDVSPAPAGDAAPEEAETEAVCYVHVCGEVESPGVYGLPEDSRIYEAIEAAGGFTDEAAEETLNLAAKISDGMQILVYSRSEAETLPEVSGAGEAGLVNLNTASKEELMTLKGIGESRAEDIIRYREEAGGFSAIEDIMKVPGIKEAGFQKIKDRITV